MCVFSGVERQPIPHTKQNNTAFAHMNLSQWDVSAFPVHVDLFQGLRGGAAHTTGKLFISVSQ